MRRMVKVELNLKGLNELMKSAEMQEHLSVCGQAVVAASGIDAEYRTHVASFVAITNVYPTTPQAAKINYEESTLQKAAYGVGLLQSK